jgi:hypothetical protein
MIKRFNGSANTRGVLAPERLERVKLLLEDIRRLKENGAKMHREAQDECVRTTGAEDPALNKRFELEMARYSRKELIVESLIKRNSPPPENEATGNGVEVNAALGGGNGQGSGTTALVRSESLAIAPLLGVKEFRAKRYLEVYAPERLKEIAASARLENLNAGRLVDTELMLWEDGEIDLQRRLKSAISVSHFRSEMQRIINREYRDVMGGKGRKAPRESYSNALTKLWEKILSKHGGDEVKAAEEYSEKSAELLTSPDGLKLKTSDYGFGTPQAVELFKLFNYDSGSLEDFLHYFEQNFDLEEKWEERRKKFRPNKPTMAKIPRAVVEVLRDYAEDRGEIMDFNPRSRYYSVVADGKVRARRKEAAENLGEGSDTFGGFVIVQPEPEEE